jgi:hypothetical protein
MTDDLKAQFIDLATVEQEVRKDIARYEREGLTPLDFAPRIRTHPSLMITSKLKMQNAIRCSTSYDEKRIQTTIFLHTNQSWLDRNINATKKLIELTRKQGSSFSEIKPGRFLYESVSVDAIKLFVNEYQVHERHEMFRKDVIFSYIDAENNAGSLKDWNLVVMGHRDSALGSIELGTDCVPNLIRRSRIKNLGESDYANIKALMSEPDICADFSDVPPDIHREELFNLRNNIKAGVGLLLIYPISPNSKAELGSPDREDFVAVSPVIGIAIVFPKTYRNSGDVDYMSADLTMIDRDEPELPAEIVDEVNN